EDCYLALGIIHGLWKPVPGRFKDYIALPKPNGYRSLHTSVFAEKGRIVEIQIRTKEMDEEAEKGIASHWLYKSSKDIKNPKKIQIKDFLWINQLQQWQKEFSRSKNFLEFLKTDFFKDRIFVLTPKGDVIDLPDGATPIDFAYQVHTEIGNQALGAKVNGKLVPFDYKLKSGELVEIILKKGKLPSSGWLEFVKMAETKKKIQEALKKKSF
ncbi:MAG: TGS domain-containing protein, partial [Candidatus Pacebacteria bacterium]|nr:TGS domain-containing protein [Candidatus Paceibacterota bacterium]